MSAAGWTTRATAAILPRLSFAAASRIGQLLGTVGWALDARHRRVAAGNLERALPELDAETRRRLVRRTFQQAGRVATEMLWSPALNAATLPRVARFDGMEHLEEALAKGKGVLITTAHFGNWELMGVALGLVGIPMNVIARKIADPAVEEVLQRLRTRTGAHVIHKEDAARSALRALRAGQVVGILIDQNTVAPQACFVPFFGHLAATTRVTAQLHLRTGAPVVMLFAIPEATGYRFLIEPLAVDPAASREESGERLTAAATARIEAHVRACPEAWLWLHDRWRTRPETPDGPPPDRDAQPDGAGDPAAPGAHERAGAP